MNLEKFNQYKNLAEQGDAEAQFQLGEYYFSLNAEAETEAEEEKFAAECIKWYTKAAKQGHAAANNSVPITF